MGEHWDVVVVGARCAGAPLAALLAARGAKVLLLEASSRGSDMPMSTHFIQPPGMDVLDRLGLGAELRLLAPPTRRSLFAMDDAAMRFVFQDGRAGYCIRRAHLDPRLQDRAEACGAVLRDRHRVVELLYRGERVVGVRAQQADGRRESIHADLVVGADGVRSKVAHWVRAPEYLTSEKSRVCYWSYYPAPATWKEDWDLCLEHQGDDIRYVFRCDGDLVLVAYAGPADCVAGFRGKQREHLHQLLLRSARIRELVQDRQSVGRVVGLNQARYFYRQPAGPGWALVGDAGHFKDYVTGHGITDALLDSERLAAAILEGGDTAMMRFWRQRDVETLPLHYDALRQGMVGFNEPFMRAMLRRAASRPALCDRIAQVFDRRRSPWDFFPMTDMLAEVGKATVRGQLQVGRGFLALGAAMAAEKRELSRRKRMLARVPAAGPSASSAWVMEPRCLSGAEPTGDAPRSLGSPPA